MGKYSVTKLPSDILSETASNVAKVRKELKWNQQELARRSGVSFGSLKRFERTGQISFESLLKIAEALDRLPEFENLIVPIGLERIRKIFED